MLILAIETSCDETAAAVIQGGKNCIKVLSSVISSQIDIHKKYGGVVPEVAAREHVLKIIPVINEVLEKADIGREEAAEKLSVIAVTQGPGLVTSLVVGVETAKTLSFAWGVPLVAVNHIEGHIAANFVGQVSIRFPAVVLTVSGGHTMIVLMEDFGKYKIIGETRDDAAGEAFDKAAQLMGIGYPGGPLVAAEAAKSRMSNVECRIKNNVSLPRPMINAKNFDFSFSGLKTALLYELKKDKNWKKRIPEYCYEFQEAVVEVLVKKTVQAAKQHGAKSVMMAGGVSANKRLREVLMAAVEKELPGVGLSIPDFSLTTDNAAMIAAAGYYKALRKEFTDYKDLSADCNLEL